MAYNIEQLKMARDILNDVIAQQERKATAIPRFMTIREVAKTGLLPEHRIREMVAKNQCPGIYCGNRFKVNYGALIELLEQGQL